MGEIHLKHMNGTLCQVCNHMYPNMTSDNQRLCSKCKNCSKQTLIICKIPRFECGNCHHVWSPKKGLQSLSVGSVIRCRKCMRVRSITQEDMNAFGAIIEGKFHPMRKINIPRVKVIDNDQPQQVVAPATE